MINKKLIDIIVPVYNQTECILEFLRAAADISEVYVNIILVNDGSNDGCEVKITDFIDINECSNFYLINKVNGGVSSARNTGLNNSVSDYIWFCDPDDVILNNVHDIISVLLNNNLVDVFVFSYEMFDISSLRNKVIKRNNECIDGDSFIVNNNKLSNDYDHPASDGTIWDKIYKKSSINDLYFDEKLICSEDFNFNLNVFKGAKKVILSDKVIYRYNVYPTGTLSSTFNEKIFNDRVKAERDTVLFLKSKKGDIRREVKKYIIKNTYLLSIKSNKSPLNFYLSEHAFWCERVYPFVSYKEALFYIFSYLNVYTPLVNIFRKLKKSLHSK